MKLVAWQKCQLAFLLKAIEQAPDFNGAAAFGHLRHLAATRR